MSEFWKLEMALYDVYLSLQCRNISIEIVSGSHQNLISDIASSASVCRSANGSSRWILSYTLAGLNKKNKSRLAQISTDTVPNDDGRHM